MVRIDAVHNQNTAKDCEPKRCESTGLFPGEAVIAMDEIKKRNLLLTLVVVTIGALTLGAVAVVGSDVEPTQEMNVEFNDQELDEGFVTISNVNSDNEATALFVMYEQDGELILAALESDFNGDWNGDDVSFPLVNQTGMPGEYIAAIFPADQRSEDYSVDDVISDSTESAFVDTDTAFISESSEENSNLSALDIAGQGTEAIIAEGQDEDVSVQVENVGDSSQSFEVQLQIPTQDEINQTQTTGELSPGQTETLTYQGVTGDLVPDTYTVFASTDDDEVVGELTVTEGAELSNLDIAGQGADATILEGDTEDITVEVSNILDSNDAFTIELAIGDAVPETESTGTLSPDESEIVTFTDMTGSLSVDDYTVSVVGGGHEVTGDLTVESPNPPEGSLSQLDIADQGTAATITENDDEDVAVLVENTGDSAGEITVDLDILDTDSNLRVDATEVTGELSPGETETVVFEAVTGSLEAPEGGAAPYDVEVQTAHDFTSGDLTVESDPTESGISNLDIAGQGDFATITAGVDEDVSIVVENVGSESATFDVTLDIAVINGDTELTETKTTSELLSGESETVTFDAVTGDLPENDYTVTVGTPHDSANGQLIVDGGTAESALSNIDIAGQAADATIDEGDDENVSVLVENVGSAADSFEIDLEIVAGQTPEVTDNQTTSELSPGQTETVTFVDVTGELSPDSYLVVLSSPDDSTDGELTVDSPNQSNLSALDIAGQGDVATVLEGANEDVSVTVENVGSVSDSFTVTLDIGTETWGETTAELDPGQTETVTFETVTGDLEPDSYTVEVATEDDTVTGDLTVDADTVSVLSNLDIAGQGTDATIDEGDDEAISVLVENVGSASGSFDVTLDIGTESWTETTVELNPDQTQTVTFETVTGDLNADDYTVEVSTDDDLATGDLSVEGAAESALANLDIAGQGVDATINEGATETVSVLVENVGSERGSFDVTLEIGDAVEETKSTSRLDPGVTTTVTFTDVTGTLDVGDYTVTTATQNDTATGDLSVITPAESALSNLDVAGQGTDATIDEAADEDISVLVENVGDESDSFTVTLDIGTDSWTETTATLAGGETETVTFETVTGDLDADDYTVEVSTDDDAVTGSLTVEAPAESALSNLNIAGQGTDATIDEGDDEDVSVLVENVGEQSGSFTVTLDIGTETWTETTGTLNRAETETVTFESVTGDLDADFYTVETSTPDDATAGDLTVDPPAEASLTELDIAGQNGAATIVEGEDEDVAVEVTHTGDTDDFDVFTVTLEIGDAVEETQSTSELRGGFSETVTFEEVTGDLAADDYTVTVSTQGDEISGSVTVQEPPEAALSGLDIAGAGDDATIVEGDDEDVSVLVENVGEAAGSFDVMLEIGETVSETETTSELASGETETVTFGDITGGLEAGAYTVEASTPSDSVTGNLMVEAPAESALSNLEIAEQGSEATVIEGANEDVSVLVENVGDLSDSFSVMLDIGTETWTETTDELDGGETETVTFESVTANLVPATYTVETSTVDDMMTGNLTVQQPAESALSELDIAGAGTETAIAVGENEDVSVLVQNFGDVAESFEVTLEIGTETWTAMTGELAGDDAEVLTFENVTGTLSIDEYDVTVSTDDDVVTGSLNVQEPAEPALSNLDIAGQGTNATITANQEANVSVTVTNVGEATDSFDVSFVFSDDGTTVVEDSVTTEELEADESETVFVGHELPATDDAYLVTVSTADETVTGGLTVEPAEESLAFADQRVSENDGVTLENVSTAAVDATVIVTYEHSGESVVAGLTTGTFDGENVSVTLTSNIGFPDNYTAYLLPTDESSQEYTPGQTFSEESRTAALHNETATVTTISGAPLIAVSGDNHAKDTTGDGFLNDVRGTGTFDIFDIQAFFTVKDTQLVNDNAEFFDFSGQGQPVDIADVQALFEQLE